MRKAKIIVAVIAIVVLGGFTWLAIHSGVATHNLHVQTIKLQSTEAKLKDVNLQVEQLKTQTSNDQAKQDQLQKDLQQKEQEKQELESKLQAKLDQKAKLELAAAQAAEALTSTKTYAAPTYSGSHSDWMAAAGIDPSDYAAVDYIVTHESGWTYTATNSSSGAYGLCQALPGSKMATAGGDWDVNPVTQLRWCSSYASGRYGSWWQAYDAWVAKHWW